MSQFTPFFNLGLQHILDLYKVEYVLFLISISVIFVYKDWKHVLVLVLFFSIGYSITYYLTAFKIIQLEQRLVEVLIFITLFLTSMSNILRKKDRFRIRGNLQRNFFLALIFGMVYGIGFANYISGIIDITNTQFIKLFAFNMGLEAGMTIVIVAYLLLAMIFVGLFGVNRRDWVLVISSGIAGVAITFLFESKYW
jgi:hypothetical protein